MQQTELVTLEKRLTKIGKSLDGLRSAAQRGAPLESTLGDINQSLNGYGAALKELRDENEGLRDDPDFLRVTALFREVRDKLEHIYDGAEPSEPAVHVTSGEWLPKFFAQTAEKHPGLWKTFEKVVYFLGALMVPFGLGYITFAVFKWQLPFLPQNGWGRDAVFFGLGFFGGLVVHEFAHGIVLANNGIGIKRVGAVFGKIIGGMVEAEEESFFQSDPVIYTRFSAAGIGCNALTAFVLLVLGALTGIRALTFLGAGDLLCGVMNAYPASPMDGGWVYEDLVERHVQSESLRRVLLGGRIVFFFLWLILFACFGILRFM